MTTITINLPEALAERVGGAARAVHRPLEEVLTAMLDGVVPSLEDVPEDMRAELVLYRKLFDLRFRRLIHA
jgi:hypothetical protein